MKREFHLLDNFKETFPTILSNPCWFEVAMMGGNANCNYQISHLFIKTPQTGLSESSASSTDIWPYLHLAKLEGMKTTYYFADNIQEGTQHQMRGVTQAQDCMALRITLLYTKLCFFLLLFFM
jgi:hypothetical protein